MATAEEVSAYRRVFDLMDTDGGGTISGDEIAAAIVKAGHKPPSEEVQTRRRVEKKRRV